MGEEYGEWSPFLYFTSHSDEALIEAVRIGRKKELNGLGWRGDPPDPQSVETYNKSKIKWGLRYSGKPAALLRFYKTLTGLKKNIPALSDPGGTIKIGYIDKENVVFMERGKAALVIFDFGREPRTIKAEFPQGQWVKALDSAETIWEGPGSNLPQRATSPVELRLSGLSVILYEKKRTVIG